MNSNVASEAVLHDSEDLLNAAKEGDWERVERVHQRIRSFIGSRGGEVSLERDVVLAMLENQSRVVELVECARNDAASRVSALSKGRAAVRAYSHHCAP